MRKASERARGFSLVEVTLALGIAAFSLVVLLGLLPVGVDTNKASAEETSAAAILANIVADLRATPHAKGVSYQSPTYRFYVPAAVAANNLNSTLYLREDGSVVSANAAPDPAKNPRYRVTVALYAPSKANGTDISRTSTGVHLTITWPALGQSDIYKPPPGYARTLEVFTTLDRN